MQNSTFNPIRCDEFSKSNVSFNGQKASGVCLAGQTVNVDLTLTDDHLLTGSDLILIDNAPGDEIKFQVVMGDTVLNQFIDWYAINFDKELNYPAKIPAGLTIRIVYKSVGASNVKVFANHDLHKVLL